MSLDFRLTLSEPVIVHQFPARLLCNWVTRTVQEEYKYIQIALAHGLVQKTRLLKVACPYPLKPGICFKPCRNPGSMQAMYERRSKLGLVGSSVDVGSSGWVSREATIGPGIDSYYEYLLKV